RATPTVVQLVVGLVVLGAVGVLVERVLARGKGRVQPVFRRGWGTDVTYWFATALVAKPLEKVVLVAAVVLLALLGLVPRTLLEGGAYAGFGPLASQPMWLQALQVYVLVDFVGYWMHRLFHRGRWWPFHAVHHSSEDLDWLASLRVHPVNDLGQKLAQALPVLLLGYDPTVTLSTAPVLTLYGVLLHANVAWDFGPLRYVLASPVFHRWHHAREREAWDRNFASLLPLWDLLFGTLYLPRGRVPQDLGICEPVPQGWLRQMAWPFGWLRRRATKVDPA
ncbi:MAG: sterol desaturase family protein, partial [Planctomycetia bacterium]